MLLSVDGYIKPNSPLAGVVEHHKKCLFVKVFSQPEGINYKETFSPGSKMNSIGLILSLATYFGWLIH
jgi:hypothetical protein